MIRKALLAMAVGASVGALATSVASAAALGSGVLGETAGSQFERTTFWGQPYPYGYAYTRGQCWRRVQVETDTGWRWKRINICRR